MLASDRFFKHVEVGDCWVWTGWTAKGYGRFHFEGRDHAAHRWLYEHLHGRVRRDTDLDHLCRNRRCVNPDHLEPVSRSTNVYRGGRMSWRRTQTHCKHGHEFTPENTKITTTGSRKCVTCHRAWRKKPSLTPGA